VALGAGAVNFLLLEKLLSLLVDFRYFLLVVTELLVFLEAEEGRGPGLGEGSLRLVRVVS